MVLRCLGVSLAKLPDFRPEELTSAGAGYEWNLDSRPLMRRVIKLAESVQCCLRPAPGPLHLGIIIGECERGEGGPRDVEEPPPEIQDQHDRLPPPCASIPVSTT
jgi:hypothetical protein